MTPLTCILVLGAGFGGLEAITELERRFRDDTSVELLLVDAKNFFLFTPLLPQIPSSYIEPRHIVQSIRDIRRDRRFRFLRAQVTGLDLTQRRVSTTVGDLPYDYLIIALGSVPNFFGIEGREHCFPLYSLEDGVLLRDHLLDLLEHADHESDPERKRTLLTLTVVGGGYTGVEVVAELRDLLFRHVAPRYGGIPVEDVKLLLLEAGPEILVGVDPKLAARARRKLEQKGIEFRTGAMVTTVRPGEVELKSGEKIATGLVIWTAGVRANLLLESLPVERNNVGRVFVTPELHLPDYPRVFAIGDNAVVRGAAAEQTVQVAPVAMEQARLAAENVTRGVARLPYRSFDYKPKGMLVSLGMNDAVVNLMGLKLSGYGAWLLWNTVHLLKLVGLKKQFQVALDWSLASLFPRDTSIIRRPHRCRFCHPESGGA
ncbi:NAD(P)/FAD-dependent oxidoreductase [Acidobacteriia bacterium AH_259_A11_L15]|nr:NAD(P)/FAD-dependent oxidoreductase [Acidobacteriia bacterium AH_259_A11_L15]